MEKFKETIKRLVKPKTKEFVDSSAWELAVSLSYDPFSLDINHLIETHPELLWNHIISAEDIKLLIEAKSMLIKDPTFWGYQEALKILPEWRTDLIEMISLLYPRIQDADRFSNLDVEWMNENEKVFKEKEFSKEDLFLLQHVVEEFKRDNSIANMYTMTNRLPDDREDLKRMVWYLHFKVMFNH